MNYVLKLFTLAAMTTLLSTTSYADDIYLGYPGYGGSGCPQGTASATLSPDSKELSIIFDEFIVEAGGDQRRVQRKTCNIAIPVHIPNGFSMSIISADYRGYVSLPNRRARATFSAEYFLAGRRGPRFRRNFRGYTDEDFIFTNNIGVRAMVWSACGADVNLRVNASMLVRSRAEALATVDSADFSSGLIYHYQLRRCRR